MAAKPMGYTRGLWLLLMLVWVCAEEDPLPDKYTGTWVGTAGSSELNIAIHGGLRKSVVGVVTDKFSYTVCQYELVYDTEESDAGVLGMVSGEDLLQEGCKNMTYSLQTVGKEKLLVDMQVVEKKEGTIEKGPMVSLVLVSSAIFCRKVVQPSITTCITTTSVTSDGLCIEHAL